MAEVTETDGVGKDCHTCVHFRSYDELNGFDEPNGDMDAWYGQCQHPDNDEEYCGEQYVCVLHNPIIVANS